MSSPDSISIIPTRGSGFGPSVPPRPSEGHDIGILGIFQHRYNGPFRSDIILKDLETQPLEGDKVESIESFKTPPPCESVRTSPTVIYVTEDDDNGLDCDCEIDVSPRLLYYYKKYEASRLLQIEDETFFCEGGCKKWFHVW